MNLGFKTCLPPSRDHMPKSEAPLHPVGWRCLRSCSCRLRSGAPLSRSCKTGFSIQSHSSFTIRSQARRPAKHRNNAQESDFTTLSKKTDDALEASCSTLLIKFCEQLREEHGPEYVKALQLGFIHA